MRDNGISVEGKIRRLPLKLTSLHTIVVFDSICLFDLQWSVDRKLSKLEYILLDLIHSKVC